VRPAGGLPAAVTVAGSLAVVLGLFFLVAWGMRRAAPRGSVLLPAEVFEVLGRAPLAGRQQAHLLRCGRKLLLVSVTPAGIETLTEVTEPLEVDRLAGLCRQAQPQGPTAAFRQIFQQWAPRDPSQPLAERREPEAVAATTQPRPGGRRWEDDNA
jgi:flagellar biogenesis protein FliO